MRIACGLLLVLLLAACAGQPDTVACQEVRPQVCTMEYNPTCAVLLDGTTRDYASPCNACADDQVTATMSGACPE